MSEVTELQTALHQNKLTVESRLRELMRAQRGIPRRLRQAMAYSLFSGGKRLRPALLLWMYEALLQNRRRRARTTAAAALDAACALEMVHTYSLIHDDLPAMDDDTLRRSKPTCHVAFDEATAILAGDGLHALAFEIIAGVGQEGARLAMMLARAVGPGGMVGGQMDDLLSEGAAVTGRRIRLIHERKTAQLIAAALATGSWLAGAKQVETDRIQAAGRQIGLAFQGADDLLDVTGDSARLGKTVGKDEAAAKATWIRLEGLERARKRTERHGRRGAKLLREILPDGEVTTRLLALVDLMWRRDH
ncbi:MAG: polyprenyl synthetase family protein [bacterium]